MATAIVIGGSIAGLLAARVLADYFEHVVILDRDCFPAQPGPRRGVPQASHQHVLMLRGQMILEKFFPGLCRELVAAGAPVVDMGQDVAWLTPAGWAIRFPSGLTMVTSTRDLLEWCIRRRLMESQRVCLRQGCEVTGLLADQTRTQIEGVQVRRRGVEIPGEEAVAADLVVDASGRDSKAPQWLEALGYLRPEETVVNSFLGYASRMYEFDRGFEWKAAYIQPAPPEVTRGGVLFPAEGNRWLLTLAGLGKDYPPTDEAGFLEFARSLRSPIFYDAICGGRPISAISGFRATENRLRHYERMKHWPRGLMVLGDAACAFNPVYAQGMTTAALAAEVMQKTLERHRRRGDNNGASLGLRFQRQLAATNAAPWLLATGEDMRVRGTVGASGDRKTRFMHRYLDEIIRLTTYRTEVRQVFLRTMHMLSTPTALFQPRVLGRVLLQKLMRSRA